jgi:hypothetical protein
MKKDENPFNIFESDKDQCDSSIIEPIKTEEMKIEEDKKEDIKIIENIVLEKSEIKQFDPIESERIRQTTNDYVSRLLSYREEPKQEKKEDPKQIHNKSVNKEIILEHQDHKQEPNKLISDVSLKFVPTDLKDVNPLGQSLISQSVDLNFQISFYNGDLIRLNNLYTDYLKLVNNEQKITFKISPLIKDYLKGFNPKILIAKDWDDKIIAFCFLSYDTSYEQSLRLIITHFSTVIYDRFEIIFSTFITFILQNFLLDELFIDLYYENKNGTFVINTHLRDILKNKLKFKWSKLEHRQTERYQKMFIKNNKLGISTDLSKIRDFKRLLRIKNTTIVNVSDRVHDEAPVDSNERNMNYFPLIYSLLNIGLNVEHESYSNINPLNLKVKIINLETNFSIPF